MIYYIILFLGFVAIFLSLNIAFFISNTYNNYAYGAFYLSVSALIIWMVYKKWRDYKGVFSATMSALTAILIVNFGMIYAAIVGISPS